MCRCEIILVSAGRNSTIEGDINYAIALLEASEKTVHPVNIDKTALLAGGADATIPHGGDADTGDLPLAAESKQPML